jgi:hypothetical protein
LNVHINGFVVLNDDTCALLLLKDDGRSGGGNDEPLVKGTLVEDVN